MRTRMDALQEASLKIASVAEPIASDLGIDAAAIALVNVAMQLLVQTHPKSEVVLWFRHQADLLETSDTPSAGGNA